jgi:hypothetical protein
MATLVIGRRYTRSQIHDELGGGLRDYLPHAGGEVVCGCFSPNLNPSAPAIVLPGTGPGIERWAKVFAEQANFVPIFLKRGSNAWEYVGDYRVRRRTDDPQDIEPFTNRTGRSDISQILYLESAS